MTSSIVEIRDFSSAAQFLDALSPRVRPWYPNPDKWVFRGQRDATWKLLPSASRAAAWLPFENVVGGMPPVQHTNDARLQLELAAVWRFCRDADREGLLIPGFDHTWVDYPDLEKKFNDLREVFAGNQFFPRAEWRPLFGMAQHYGIPTRLLDWSERALVAAYFAASGASGPAEGSGRHMAVWALDHTRLGSIASSDERVIVVRAPLATNPNLRAQRGLFTLHGVRLRADRTAVDAALDDAIGKLAGSAQGSDATQRPCMYLYCLPAEKAPLLLHLLDQEGTSAASIYPGYKGVVDALRESHGAVNYRDDPTESFGPSTVPGE